MPIETVLFRRRRWYWTAGAVCAIVAVGLVDYLTEPDITFSPFYLVPVAIAAWLGGSWVAFAASTFAAIVWLGAEYASSRVDSHAFVYTWNFFARGLFLLPIADETAARAVVEKLRTRAGEALRLQDTPVTLSIGVVSCKPGAAEATVDALLESADRLMYAVKSSGKSGARFGTCD